MKIPALTPGVKTELAQGSAACCAVLREPTSEARQFRG